ncbi:MAG: nucleoside-binding protein [Gemmatimonadota bacterium]|nr:nucleoside-binding protein [Gemmatimonadota bacterium]MDE2870872.1 nucleoside-binding protein [Gemmatimonadota bacterium]
MRRSASAMGRNGWTSALVRRLGATVLCAGAAPAAGLAQTELNLLHGEQVNPFGETVTTSRTTVLTVQHYEQWRYGDVFLFIDLADDADLDGFNDDDAYGEFFANLSLGKVLGADLGFGPILDFGVVAGASFGADDNIRQWLPSFRIAWRVPGFVFLTTDFALAMDAGGGVQGRGRYAKRDDHLITSVVWLLPFAVAGQSFSFAGFAEHQSGSSNVPVALFSQPQLRWDIGGASGLMLGVEGLLWFNKLGTKTHEANPQLMLVWEM